MIITLISLGIFGALALCGAVLVGVAREAHETNRGISNLPGLGKAETRKAETRKFGGAK